MKKKISLIILFLITLVILVPSVNAAKVSLDAGKCLKKYGGTVSGGIVSSDGSESTSKKKGKVSFSGAGAKKKLSWKTYNPNFTVKVYSSKDYYIDSVQYRLGTCNGEITGFTVPTKDKTGVTYLSFTINVTKGNILDFSVWGVQSKFIENRKVKKSIGRETQQLKREAADSEDPISIDDTSSGTQVSKGVNCDTFLEFINKYWTWIIVLAPILTIVVIAIDLLGAIISSDAEKLKKVGNNSIKRMAALVILLFLPYILDIVFGWFNLDFCWRK